MLTQKEIEKHEFDVFNARDITEYFCQNRYLEVVSSFRQKIDRVFAVKHEQLDQAHKEILQSLDLAENIELMGTTSTSVLCSTKR